MLRGAQTRAKVVVSLLGEIADEKIAK
jgi:hypothetical protein